jgi:hypothetical protein
MGAVLFSIISLTSVLDLDEWSTPHPGRLSPGKQPRTHCTGGWVGPRAGPNMRVKCRPTRI